MGLGWKVSQSVCASSFKEKTISWKSIFHSRSCEKILECSLQGSAWHQDVKQIQSLQLGCLRSRLYWKLLNSISWWHDSSFANGSDLPFKRIKSLLLKDWTNVLLHRSILWVTILRSYYEKFSRRKNGPKLRIYQGCAKRFDSNRKRVSWSSSWRIRTLP